MTQPKQARQRSGNGPRIYAWPPTPPHEFEVLSVTSALKFLPKEFLVGWAAKMAAECAWKDFDVLTLLHGKGDQTAFKNHVKGARFRDMAEKASRGTIVHAALEAYVEGILPTKDWLEEKFKEADPPVPQRMWNSTAGMISGVLDFFQMAEPEVLWSESTVYSRTHGYAGTADLIALMHIGESRVPVVIDVKTGKSIYDDTSLQLAAYARADFVGRDDGTEAPLLPIWPNGGLPHGEHPHDYGYGDQTIEHGVVVRPMASGKFETATFALTDDVFEMFLAALTLARLNGADAKARRPS